MAKGHDGANKEDEVGFMDPAANKRSVCARMCGSLSGLCHFIYDPKTHLIMGRNCKEWGQLILFYVIFYACLIGFWIACLSGFLATTNVDTPTLTGFQSMLQLNPAIGYRPQPNYESNLIKFNMSDPATYKDYLASSNELLATYAVNQSKLLDCSGAGVSANLTTACQFKLTDYKECLPEAAAPYKLGFDVGTPCIVLKMNRIYGWLPKTVENTTNQYSDIKVRCKGENDADVETVGAVNYYPGGSDENGPYGLISAKYFPYMKQSNYLSPLVFVQFANIKKYTISLIWCQFDQEAMNFVPNVYQYNDRAGGARFELLVDANPSAIATNTNAATANAPASVPAPASAPASASASAAVTTTATVPTTKKNGTGASK